MNRIYKTIWSKTRGMYIVVSELAKGHAKSPSVSRKAAASVLAAFLFLLSGSVAMAEGLTADQQVVYDAVMARLQSMQDIECGNGSTAALNGDRSSAVDAEDNYHNDSDTGSRALAIGVVARSNGLNNFAVAGGIIEAGVDRAVAMGEGSYAKSRNSFAAAGGIVEKNSANAVAMGKAATAKLADSVSLGSASVADTAKGVDGYLKDTSTGAAWTSTYNAVSVGNVAGGVTRQITGVAAGSQDTDAVNVAQLKVLDEKITGSQVHFFSAKGNSSEDNYNNNGAIGDRALAIGVGAKASGLRAVALTGGIASGDYSFAVGNNTVAKGWATVAFGSNTLAEQQGAVAIGDGAKAYSLNAVALGNNTQAGAPKGQPGAGNMSQTAMGSGSIATGGAATALGYKSVASGAHAIAGGDSARATGQDSVSLGHGTEASGTWSVALGINSKAQGQSSTALGTTTTASGAASTAMGSKTQATGVGSTAMGGATTAQGEWSLASGAHSQAIGKYSTAMGDSSKANGLNSFAVSGGVVNAGASNAVAMGKAATANLADSVSLGSASVADTAKGVDGYLKDTSTGAAWTSTHNAVSVGNVAGGVTRQITGVAAGSQDTDAVNVAQLKALDKKITGQIGSSDIHYYSAKSSQKGAGANYTNDGAKAQDSIVLGISSTSEGINSTVIGNNNTLTGVKNNRNNSIVVGQNLTVEGTHNAVFGTDYRNYDNKITHVAGEQNTVLGVGNLVGYTAAKDSKDPTKWIYTKLSRGSDQNVAVGLTNTANGGSVVVGTSSTASEMGSSFGHGNTVLSSNEGGGQWGIALGNSLTAKGEMALVIGNETTAEGHYVVAIGTQNVTAKSFDMAIGYQAKATGQQSIALGTISNASELNAIAMGTSAKATVSSGIALGANSVADREEGVIGYDPSTGKAFAGNDKTAWKSGYGALSVGKDGGTRQITNVSAGSADTDAVNVAQLKQAVATATTDGNTTYELSSKENGNTTTITLTGSDGKKSEVTVSTKDTTLKSGGLSVSNGKLHVTVEDTAGNQVTGSVDLSDIATGVADGNTTYELSSKENDNNTTTITLTGSDGKKNEVAVATKDTRNTIKEGENVSVKEDKNADGSSTYTVSVKADGKVESGNTGIVSGDTVYKETHVKEDGIYVKKEYSAGENLTALDKQVATNTNSITSLQNNIYEVDRNLSKVGAGAAALAALHPLDFDPEDKWDIAAGFGNYRDASAVALGVFYRPNEYTMLSLGTTLGDGRNLFNAGLSIKLGSGETSMSMTKAQMAETIRKQDNEIQAMKAREAARDMKDAKRDAQLEALLKELEVLKAGK